MMHSFMNQTLAATAAQGDVLMFRDRRKMDKSSSPRDSKKL